MSKHILVFDSESNGLPIWKEPSESKGQPHLTQLGAILCDDKGQIARQFEVIIKPDDWEIPDEVVELNGITTEMAMDVGIPEIEALKMFLDLYDHCEVRVAHNTTFDNRMIRIALKRYMPDLIPDEVWKNKESYYCTLMKARKIMGGKSGHTLAEAYHHFTGKELENAHTALADASACMEIYFAIQLIEKDNSD